MNETNDNTCKCDACIGTNCQCGCQEAAVRVDSNCCGGAGACGSGCACGENCACGESCTCVRAAA